MEIVILWLTTLKYKRCTLATKALELINVNSYYGDSHVLYDLSLSLKEGTLLALLGRNGAGKTTLMKTISGLLVPRNGSILLFGKPIDKEKPEQIAKAGVRLVPQGRRIFPV
jgi:branched-chain amino acid transport system ATP-binding protein